MDVFILLEGIRQGVSAGGWLSNLLYGEGINELNEGARYVNKLFETHDIGFADRALSQFQTIKTTNKQYIVALSLFFEAVCYAFKGQYNLAYDSLDRLEKIETRETVFGVNIVAKPETIRSVQNKVSDLRSIIRQLEANGYRLLASNEEPKREIASNTNKNSEALFEFVKSKLTAVEGRLTAIESSISTELAANREELQKLHKETQESEKIIVSSIIDNNQDIKNEIAANGRSINNDLREIHYQGYLSKKLIIWILCIVAVSLSVSVGCLLCALFN